MIEPALSQPPLPVDHIRCTDGSRMVRRYGGRLFVAASAWRAPDHARAAAALVRRTGSLARVTSVKRTRRRRDPRDRYAYVVWVCEKPACAENSGET